MSAIQSVGGFFYSQFFKHPAVPTKDCSGKTVIVTGSNVGLGKEAVAHFVRLNAAKVIIACRTPAKGAAAQADIEAARGRKGVVEVWQLDLESYDSIRAFVKRANALPRLDIMVNNAGVQKPSFSLVAGYEAMIAVNVVSTILLSLMILPKLEESARKFGTKPTLSIVASDTHYFAQFPERKAQNIFAALNDPTAKWSTMERYSTSKLLEIFAVRDIAERAPYDRIGVTVNCLTPGFCHSELQRDAPSAVIEFMKKLTARTTEVGGRTLVDAGLREGPETHGKYLQDCEVRKCACIVEGRGGAELQKRFWAELAAELEKIEPGVTKVLGA